MASGNGKRWRLERTNFNREVMRYPYIDNEAFY